MLVNEVVEEHVFNFSVSVLGYLMTISSFEFTNDSNILMSKGKHFCLRVLSKNF